MSTGLLMYVLLIFALLFTSCSVGMCLETDEIVRLKNAGVSNETIQLMVREKTQETCAFTAKEVIALKEAGLKEETIQMLIEEGSFMKEGSLRIYGNSTRSMAVTSTQDIIELKSSGLSDEVIQAVIAFGARDTTDEEREKAWDMLSSLGILLDRRDQR